MQMTSLFKLSSHLIQSNIQRMSVTPHSWSQRTVMLTLTSTRSTKNEITVDQFHHAKKHLTISVNLYLVGTNECGKTTATIITTVVKQLQVPRMSQPLLIQALKHLFGRLKSFCKLISIATSSIRLRT